MSTLQEKSLAATESDEEVGGVREASTMSELCEESSQNLPKCADAMV